jgi:peptide/nickel transport system permease protein
MTDVRARLAATVGEEAEPVAAPARPQPETGRPRGPSRHPVLRALLRSPGGVVGAVMLGALIVLAIIGPVVWGARARRTDLNAAYQKHSGAHLLGTDSLGRDVLARTLAATRLTLELGLAAAAISAVVGFGIGTAVSALGPRLRGLARRGIETSMSFPPILLALFLVAIIGTGTKGAVIAVGLGAAPSFARLAENLGTSVAAKEFAVCAKAMGIPRWRMIRRYLLPNMVEPLALSGLAYFAGAIIDISGLDFLGVGVQPRAYDWGTLLTSGVQSLYVTPYAGLAPAVMITLTGLSLVYFGEGAARALNPRLWGTVRSGRRGDPWARSASVAPESVDDAATGDAVLVVENLTVSAPSATAVRPLVDGVSLRLRAGEIVGIVGETGSGKTLTTLALGDLLPYPLRMTTDRLELDGVALDGLAARPRRRALGSGLAMIFQDPMSSMNPAARVGAQLTDAARAHRSLSRAAARAEAASRLAEVQLGNPKRALRRYPHQFSGGMRQRIMIAMGLMVRPRVLIADEPTTALDVTVQAQVLEVLREIREKENTAILLISHNLGVINQLCDRVLVMYAGRVVEEGTREQLLRQPRHPYTQALLAAVPELPGPGVEEKELRTIPGRPPGPHDVVPGCAFAPRCPVALDECGTAAPPLTSLGDAGKVACFVAVRTETAGSAR